MRSRLVIGFILLASTVLLLFSQESEPLGDAARRLHRSKTNSKHQADGLKSQNKGIASTDPQTYMYAIRTLLLQEDFDELDRTATKERSTKERFPGGSWKLFNFYLGVSGSKEEGTSASELTQILGHLKNWVVAKPNSITARVALANAYDNYAWAARGDGYADSVPNDAWKAFDDRLQLARATLDEATKLPDKCPQWYLVMMRVLRGQGADLTAISAVLEEASSFEPLYYYYYDDYAFTLLPRWSGEEGDSERFGDQISSKIGGANGEIIYFEIASELDSRGEPNALYSALSWPKIQQGYTQLEKQYGVGWYQLNRFAHIAVREEDKSAAAQAFVHIGQHWDEDIWGTRSHYDMARAWAMPVPADFQKLWRAALNSLQSPGGAQYRQQLISYFDQENATAVNECMQIFKDDTEAFWVIMKLDQNGDVQDLAEWPATNLSNCIVPKLGRHAPAPPPQTPFWINVAFTKQAIIVRTVPAQFSGN